MTSITSGAATDLGLNADGVGHMLLVPYYTVQGNNHTMINIVNTDTVNGKAVKVRFRGASNSDDVYDFQVFLSPGDVWAADVSKNASTGTAMLTTPDNSCTKPVIKDTPANANFVTSRLDSSMSGDTLANQTREGYVEIFNMADIVPGTALFTYIKHVNNVPPCATLPQTNAAWTALDTDTTSWAGLTLPTTGLMADWIILNGVNAGAWSGAAPAITAQTTLGITTTGNLVYWPQMPNSLSGGTAAIANFTADPVLRSFTPALAQYDLPDMSTPYTSTANTGTSAGPVVQASALSYAIATRNVINEFLTNPAIASSTTDWLLSMPTRRYSVALSYSSGSRLYTDFTPTGKTFFDSTNTSVVQRQICLSTLTAYTYNQEEAVSVVSQVPVISPGSPTIPNPVCGEVSVMSINHGDATASPSVLITAASGTLQSTVGRSAPADNGFVAGWINLLTPGLGYGLPVVGGSFERAANSNGTYGITLPHRTTRAQMLVPY